MGDHLDPDPKGDGLSWNSAVSGAMVMGPEGGGGMTYCGSGTEPELTIDG